MLKKILKYTFRTLLVILLVLILVPALLYIPAVQDFVRSKAVGYASRTLGMDLSVERLRLSFPLRLSVDNTLLTDKGDTLLSCGHLSLEVAVWPLLRKEVAVRSLELAKLAAHYGDSTAGMDLKVAAGQFAVNDCRVGLPAKTVGISRIALTDGDVFLNTAESAPAEKADSAAALPWQIDVGKLTVANLVFGMRTAPAVTDLSVRLPDGEVDSCRVLLDSRQVSVKSILLNRGGYAYLTAPADAGEKAPDKTATQGKAAHPDKTAAADNASSPHDAAADDGEAPALPWTVRIGSVTLNDTERCTTAPRRDSIRRSSSSRRSTCRSIRSTTGAPTSPFGSAGWRLPSAAGWPYGMPPERSQWTPPAFRSPGSSLQRRFPASGPRRTPEPESCEWRPTPR